MTFHFAVLAFQAACWIIGICFFAGVGYSLAGPARRKEKDVDEYLRRLDPDYTPRMHR